MKRKTFLTALLSIIGLASGPFKSFATKLIDGTGFMVASGEDRFGKNLLMFGADTFSCKVSTKDTDGDIYIFESTRITKAPISPHFHYEQDEWWYVLQGEFNITIGDKTHIAKKGDSVFGPRMIPHSFAKNGEEVGKLLIVFQPAGKMEDCFKKMSEGHTNNLSKEERSSFFKEHGLELV